MDNCTAERKRVLFFTEGVSYRLPKRRLLRRWLQDVSAKEGYTLLELRVILCSSAYLLSLNRHYLSHDTQTDVITFDCRTSATDPIDGEVYVDPEQVKTQARARGRLFFDELVYVIVHGLLHLCGYDDTSASERVKMRDAEARSMRSFRSLLAEETTTYTHNVSRET